MKRRSPKSGKQNIYIFPSKAALYARGMIYIGSGVIEYALACACRVTKTVGPPDSGKLNVRWDRKGMVNWS